MLEVEQWVEVALEAVERVAAVLEGTERVEPEAVVAVERAALRDGAAAGGVKGTAAEVMLVVARQALAALGLVAVEAVAKAAVATVVQVGVAVARMVEGVVEGVQRWRRQRWRRRRGRRRKRWRS